MNQQEHISKAWGVLSGSSCLEGLATVSNLQFLIARRRGKTQAPGRMEGGPYRRMDTLQCRSPFSPAPLYS